LKGAPTIKSGSLGRVRLREVYSFEEAFKGIGDIREHLDKERGNQERPTSQQIEEDMSNENGQIGELVRRKRYRALKRL
jgi:hypothetical protein